MTKLLKIIGRIVGISFEWILIFLIFILFAIHTSPFQTFITKKITNYLSSELKTEIKIDRVSIVWINRIALDGLLIRDQKNDTLAYVSTIFITVDELNLRQKIILNEAEIENSVFKFKIDKKSNTYNYEFIEDYFATSKRKKSSTLVIELNELHLSNVSLDYDDERSNPTESGMDFKHLKVKNINLNVNEISVKKGVIKGCIHHLSLNEKSGFKILNYSGIATVSEKGVYTRNVKLQTPLSNIYASKVNLLTNHYQDFLTFEDSVSFDSHLNYSKISLKDISYFSPQLEGMDQLVYAQADVSRTTKRLKINNLILKTGDQTTIKGTLVLPDFRNFNQAFFNERFDYAFISMQDLKKIKLPTSAKSKFISFDDHLERLNYFEVKNLRLDGYHDEFVIAADNIATSLGEIEMKNGILFTENAENKSYIFKQSDSEEKNDVVVDNFELGAFLQNPDIGSINGILDLSGEAKSFSDIRFDDIEGEIKKFDYLGYSYKNILIKKGKLINHVFDSEIEIQDDNLALTYNGSIDFRGKTHMKFTIDLTKAILDNLNLSDIKNSKIKSNFDVNIYGDESNNLFGTINLDGLVYWEGNKQIKVPNLSIIVDRKPTNDILEIKSDLADIYINGKVDFKTILGDLENQVSKLFPAIISPKKINKKKPQTKSKFDYDFKIKEVNTLLSLFIPDLKISKGTTINGFYNGLNETAEMSINSQLVQYKEMRFEGIDINQKINTNDLSGRFSIKTYHLNDSVRVNDLLFIVNGTKEILNSQLLWDPQSKDESKISWNTNVLGIDHYKLTLLPSFFNLKQKKWSVVHESIIQIKGTTIDIDNFLLEREKQYLSINGRISKSNEDQLNFRMNDFKLDDFGSLFSLPVDIKGLVNGWGYISNPYTNLQYMGDANIQDFYVNNREVGSLYIQSQWDSESTSFGMAGDLIFRGNETFSFNGNYNNHRTSDKLELELIFDNTDIQFVNSFMDPDLMTNIRGLLVGSLNVRGTIENPELQGTIELQGGNAKLEILNVNFGLNGKISCDKNGFYVNKMPIDDEEGNSGSLVGAISHNQFKDWNFDLNFDLKENSDVFGFAPGYKTPLDKFLLMNTSYKEGDVYYGKGYGTGTVNISGFTDNLAINVDLNTEKGTKVNFPMYGMEEIQEQENFIAFKNKGEEKQKEPKIDFTGVDLKLNINVTPDAELKVILNESTGDEVAATGTGDIFIGLNNQNDFTLDGTFKIKEGHYDFVMKPINQQFDFEPGGTVTWSGDPYKAFLDVKCSYKVNANLNEISPNQNLGASGTGKQEIKCLIMLTESLFKPKIEFDIVANTNEAGKALLTRIKTDRDLLNKEFFSLLLFKKFQRIDGQTSTGGGGESAALDLVSSQINAMLSQVSKDYLLNVDLAKNNLTGGERIAVGMTKVINDRLVLTGSFGVGTAGTISQNQNSVIGDVNIQYKLNESGTFTVNVFNESNQNSILQNKIGLFTQGAGIHYQEDFNTLNDFKLLQYFVDVFRKKENKRYKVKRNKKQSELPPLKENKISFTKQELNFCTKNNFNYYFTTL